MAVLSARGWPAAPPPVEAAVARSARYLSSAACCQPYDRSSCRGSGLLMPVACVAHSRQAWQVRGTAATTADRPASRLSLLKPIWRARDRIVNVRPLYMYILPSYKYTRRKQAYDDLRTGRP